MSNVRQMTRIELEDEVMLLRAEVKVVRNELGRVQAAAVSETPQPPRGDA